MWNNREMTRGPIKTWNMQEPEMVTLCNKKVTRTRTISNATGYSIYTWAIACTRGKHLQLKCPPAWQPPCYACQSSSMTICFSSQIKTLLWRFCQIRHRCASVMRLLWRTVFHHKFVIKLKLWWIWLLQWWNLFIVEMDISSSDCSVCS